MDAGKLAFNWQQSPPIGGNRKATALLAVLLLGRAAFAQEFTIPWHTVDGGGGAGGADGLFLQGSAGQPDAGTMKLGKVIVTGGFWSPFAAVPTSPEPVNPIVWTNTAGGSWIVAANWSPNQVPTLTNDVFITNSGTYTVSQPVTHDAFARSLTLGGLSGTQTFAMNFNKPLSVAGLINVQVNGVLQSGNNITNFGAISVDGLFRVQSGTTIRGNGLFYVGERGRLEVPFDLVLIGQALVNQGTTVISDGQQVVLGNNSVFTNMPGLSVGSGTLILTNSGSGIHYGGSGGNTNQYFANLGILRSHTSALINVPTMLGGLIQVLGGELTVQRHLAFNAYLADISADIDISQGAALVCDRGTHQFRATSILRGAGGFRSTGGNTAYLNGIYSLTGPLVLNNDGNINFNTGAPIIPATVTMDGGSSIATADPIRITNSLTGASVNISGAGSVIVDAVATVAVNGGSTLSCAFFENNGVFRNHGVTLNFGGSLRFTNRPGALFLMTTNNTGATSPSVGVVAGNPLFVNEGGLRSDTPATAHISPPLRQHGTLQVQAGTLVLGGSGVHTGAASIPAGSVLHFAGLSSSSQFLPGSMVTGAGGIRVHHAIDFRGSYEITGLLDVEGAAFHFNTGSPMSVPHVRNNGDIGGDDPLTITDTLRLSGTFSGPAPLYLAETLTTSLDFAVTLLRPCMVNAGVMLCTNGMMTLGSNVVVTNLPTGLIVNTGPTGFWVRRVANTFGQAFYNEGTMRMNAGSAAEFQLPFFSSGTLRVESGGFQMAFGADWTQTAGVTEMAGGNLRFFGGSAWLLHGGVVTGNGTVFDQGAQNFGAIISPGNSAGEILFEKSLNQSPNGAMHIELGGTAPGTGYDRITVTDTLFLTGSRLHVSLTNGFIPVPGTKFLVATAITRVGTFSTFIYPSNQIALKLNYLPNGVEVEAIASQPRIEGMAISGANLIITGTGGSPHGTYCVLTSTNVARLLTNWTYVQTNVFDSVVAFSLTIYISPQVAVRFYLLQSP